MSGAAAFAIAVFVPGGMGRGLGVDLRGGAGGDASLKAAAFVGAGLSPDGRGTESVAAGDSKCGRDGPTKGGTAARAPGFGGAFDDTTSGGPLGDTDCVSPLGDARGGDALGNTGWGGTLGDITGGRTLGGTTCDDTLNAAGDVSRTVAGGCAPAGCCASGGRCAVIGGRGSSSGTA